MINRRTPLTFAGALTALVAIVASLSLPASARSAYVQDDAHLFSAATVSSLNSTIGSFNSQTGKEVVVVTVASLDGTTAEAAAEKTFAQQQVNGVLVFLSKAEKKQGIVPDRAAASFFPPGEIDTIRQAMRGYFRTGDFDTGITTGVNLILDQYRSHVRASGGSAVRHQQFAPAASTQSFGGGMSLFWLILILIAGFLIIRAVFRAIAGPRRMPPGYGGGQGPGYGGPGYGGPGYGGGYGGGMGGGGGGGFMSGLLGGLGGAFLGNELFGRNNGGGFGGGNEAGFGGGDQQLQQQDSAGWQNDAGQADMGNASFGDYGSSGGGFGDGGGGGGDFGGGGGGDSGGGW